MRSGACWLTPLPGAPPASVAARSWRASTPKSGFSRPISRRSTKSCAANARTAVQSWRVPMAETPFIITIDTEGDDLWARPREITTRNAEYLPRFQSLCERFGFKPVYLTNYEMAMSDAFVAFGRDVAARGAGEIGMHLHAWNSPPLVPLNGDDFGSQPYLIEYPAPVMAEKIKTLTHLLENRFEQKMLSHRAGRWALDGRYAA